MTVYISLNPISSPREMYNTGFANHVAVVFAPLFEIKPLFYIGPLFVQF
jgi:hypothetical protein